MVPDFGIDVTRTGDAAVVRVIGELDLATAPRLREEIVAPPSAHAVPVQSW